MTEDTWEDTISAPKSRINDEVTAREATWQQPSPFPAGGEPSRHRAVLEAERSHTALQDRKRVLVIHLGRHNPTPSIK